MVTVSEETAKPLREELADLCDAIGARQHEVDPFWNPRPVVLECALSDLRRLSKRMVYLLAELEARQ